MSEPRGLRHRIGSELSGIIRGHVLVLTSVLVVCALLLGYHLLRAHMAQQHVLISHKLGSELANAAYEMQVLATASLVGGALREGGRAHADLESLVTRLNANPVRHFMLLDERGHVFVAPGQDRGRLALGSAVLQQALASGAQAQALVATAEGTPLLVLMQPVQSAGERRALGFVVASIDAGALLRPIGMQRLAVSLSIGDAPLSPTPPRGLWLRDESSETLSSGDMNIAFRVLLVQPVLPVLVGGLLVACMAWLFGLWVLRRVRAWAWRFSGGMTARLEEVVVLCQKLLAGQGESAPPAWTPADEIDRVVHSLSQMMRTQRQLMDELATTSLVFETAADGIVVMDAQGLITRVNPALLRMSGFDRHEVQGRPSAWLYRMADRQGSGSTIARALERTERWSGEGLLARRSGSALAVSISVSRLPAGQGPPKGHVAVITDVSRLKAAEGRLRELAYRDALTRLPNLRAMTEQVRHRLRGDDSSFLLLFLDLDHLKAVNDTYGHEAGDWMIRGMAEHLQRQLPPGHLLCRRSGDEFLALVDADPAQPRDHWEPLLRRLTRATLSLPAGPLGVTATLGVVRYPQDAGNWHELQLYADVAMTAAKQQQRGSLAWYDSHLGQQVLRQRQIYKRLAQAVEQQIIEVHYQPVVDMVSGQVLAFEALARWRDPVLGEVRSHEFMAVAEQTELLHRLTAQLLSLILRDKQRLQQRFAGVVMAFNAPLSLFQDAWLVKFLAELAADDPQLLSCLQVELTEADVTSSLEQLQNPLQVLADMGVRLAIDDFGRGASSLSRLALYPVSCLKIDPSFVARLGQDRSWRIVEMIVHMARVLEIDVTAEGVHTERQREMLMRMGCRRGQGGLYAPALPLELALRLPDRLPMAPTAG